MCCAILRANMHAEVQEGKFPMPKKKYWSRLGTTSACVCCLLDAALKFDTIELVNNDNGEDNIAGDIDVSEDNSEDITKARDQAEQQLEDSSLEGSQTVSN